jgi:hypothetical protein
VRTAVRLTCRILGHRRRQRLFLITGYLCVSPARCGRCDALLDQEGTDTDE